MKAYKKIIGTAFVAVCLIIVIVTFIKVKGINSSDKLVLQLAHNQSAGSEIADSIAKVSDFAAKESGDEVNIKIFASGVLGTEKEEIEMVKAGIIDMAKVSSNTLGQFDDRYAIFAIPYLFKNQEHYYNAMENSEAVKELFADTADDGYIAVGYYANGARNFYLKDDVPVTDTSVLSGKKIRSMPSSTSMDMIEKMGGTPVPMAASETYASLQQGVVDGAENTELALTVDGHEDLVKVFVCLESKVFGIGVESYTVGSSEFCMNYVARAGITPLMDNGHYHPTEVVSDKVSSMLLFNDHLALHITRPVRWDSDHVVLYDDETREIAKEIVRADALDKVFIATDYFDASINRISAWITGMRSVQKALLYALLEPESLRNLQNEGRFTELMAAQEELKIMPFGDIWQEYLNRENVAADYVSEVMDYEKKVLEAR